MENIEEISIRQGELIKKSNILCCCSPISDIQFSFNNQFDIIKEILENHRNGKHKGIRFITSINNKNDIEVIKVLLNQGINIRHISDILFYNFVLSDKLFASTIEKKDRGKLFKSLLISNDPLYINHYNKIFEEIWKNGLNAEERIKDLEEDNYVNMKIIPDSHESFKITNELFMLAKYEVLIILPSVNGIIHAVESGSFRFLDKMVLKGVKVKILTVFDHKNPNILDKIKTNYPNIEFRSLQFEFQVLNRITILDRTKTMISEIKKDIQNGFIDALGIAIFIESKSTALTYASIFDSLWKQTDTYDELKKSHEQLQIHDKMQKEFINIVAHELRTPLTPILGLTEYIRDKTNDVDQKVLLDIVIDYAFKLHILTEKILDVTRIDGKLFNLNYENFSLNQLILDIVKDFEKNLKARNKKIKFEYSINFNTDYLLSADKTKIGKVISNLVENSIKFISNEEGGEGEGIISFNIEKKHIVNTKNGNTSNIIIIIIKDNGIGINSDIRPRLFTKFASKSFQGTGLGLFISKNIIEAHGGKIWGENNPDEDKGATFSFSLPLKE
ncbi:MAG: HAMP domain-containing histidine kinase [Nitrosopumilus sp.]|nr:HAMP domain-containing histidine kinase [Nitrosopumilus sp.]